MEKRNLLPGRKWNMPANRKNYRRGMVDTNSKGKMCEKRNVGDTVLHLLQRIL